MKSNRFYKLISIMLSAMLVLSLFPTSALAAKDKNTDPLPEYTVNFVDWDGSLIDTVQVEEGSAATAPTHPEREGYVTDGWDKDFSNVTGDMTVTAVYKEAGSSIFALAPLAQSYSLTYNANGATGSMTDPSSPYASGATFTVLDNQFAAPTGKYFIGWNSLHHLKQRDALCSMVKLQHGQHLRLFWSRQ